MKKLESLTILNTRPESQATTLTQQLEEQGANVIPYPVIEIQKLANTHELEQLALQLNEYDLLIFVSANAVKYSLPTLESAIHTNQPKLAVIGAMTQHALEEAGLSVDIFPVQQYSSEGLLEHSELQSVSGCKMVILRAQSGRELLAKTLSQRGADVKQLTCYHRLPCTPIFPPSDLPKLGIDIIIITSQEILHTLLATMDAGTQLWFKSTSVLTISERIANTLRQLGFQYPLVSAQASESALLDCIYHI